MNKLTIVLFATLLAFTLQAQQTVTVELDFGDETRNETVQVDWHKGMTAMVALQNIAVVETYSPAKNLIFVTAINGVRTRPGEMAWYYTVNSEGAGVLAVRKPVQSDDVIRWIYRKDVCTSKAEEK